MAKQTLGVFTENELDRNYMCKILSQVFPRLWILSLLPLPPYTRLQAEPAAILGQYYLPCVRRQIFSKQPNHICPAFFGQQSLTSAFELPEGTPVLVANKPRRIAEDLVENLQQLGINHLNYIPYWPG